MVPDADVDALTPGDAYGTGSRLLISGEPQWGSAPLDAPIAWSCGFSRYYAEKTAPSGRRPSSVDVQRWRGPVTAAKLNSRPAVDGHSQSFTEFAHPTIGQPPEPVYQHSERNALNRVEISRHPARDRVVAGLEDDLACETSNDGGARHDKSPAMTRNHGIAG